MRPRKIHLKFTSKQIFLSLFFLVAFPGFCMAFKIGPDIEKPKPEFTRSGDQITAKMIPRAKSTSVEIRFQVKNGRLAGVSAYDWETAERPEVDVKNFKSSLFEIQIDSLPPGGDAVISISSDFFISSTEFYVFNPNVQPSWVKDADVQNISRPERVKDLAVKVKDGGPLDADGSVDGHVTIIGGPRDSFWGYALGTLFIRFFGIFIVLTILMIGMIVSGKVFKRLDAKTAQAKSKISHPPEPQSAEEIRPPVKTEEIPDVQAQETELAAAISAALHIHFSQLQPSDPMYLVPSHLTPWTQQGRNRIMGQRFQTFNRTNR